MKRALLPTLLCVACAGPLAPPAPTLAVPPFTLLFEPPESARDEPELQALFARGGADVERFFGRPFPGAFEIAVVPDRTTFDAVLPTEWGLGRTECWMVAAGWGGGVIAIAPRAWHAEACEHDPDDAGHVRRLLTHELVHVYHGEHNPSPDFVEVTGLDWFVEGLATYASGQLAEEHAGAAREALAAGAGPRDLATAWSGRHRYGVCGSLVAFVDREWGRATLVDLLAETDGARLLARLGVTEAELLAAWSEAVLAGPSREEPAARIGLAGLAPAPTLQEGDAPPHPLTGVWEGQGSGDSELLPPGGFPFRLVLEGLAEDEAVAWLTLGEAAVDRAEVEFDPDTGELWFRGTLTGIVLDAELLVEGETLTGTLRGLGVTVDLEGRRSSRELPEPAARGATARRTVPLAAMTVDDWRTDLAFLADALPQRHPGAFDHLSRDDWARAVAALDARLPELPMPGILVELARLVARLGDAHTMLPLQGDPFGKVLPVRFTWFADGLFVTAVDADHPDALGLRVVRLGTRSIDEALALVASTFASENESWTRHRTPRFLVDGVLLGVLGIVEDAARLPLVLEVAPGETIEVVIEAPGSGQWRQAPDPRTDELPLWRQRTRETYWFAPLENGAGVYWAYNTCAEDPARPIESFVGEVLAALDAAGTRRLVIDLRNNTGGNSAVLSSQLARIAEALGEEGQLWGLIGPATFSSGMLNAVELRRRGARLAGEPTGGKPNGWGEVKVFQLPRSGLAVQHSTRFFRLGEDDSPSLEPDLRVPLESPDGLTGADPVLEAVLAAD